MFIFFPCFACWLKAIKRQTPEIFVGKFIFRIFNNLSSSNMVMSAILSNKLCVVSFGSEVENSSKIPLVKIKSRSFSISSPETILLNIFKG